MKVEIYVDAATNEWRARIVTDDDEILFTSKGYQEHSSCYLLIDRLKKQIGDASVCEIGTIH